MRILKITKILTVIAAGLVCAAGFGAPAKTAQTKAGAQKAAGSKIANMFYVSVAPSLQPSNMDWWFRLPDGAEPQLAQTNRVFFAQKFNLYLFAENAAVDENGAYKIKYAISMRAPDGSRSNLKSAYLAGKKKNAGVIVADSESVEITLDKPAKEGVYVFGIEAEDCISGAKSSSESSVTLASWSAPLPAADGREMLGYIRFFYIQPSPELLWSMYFSDKLNLEQKGAPNMLNYSLLGFFVAAFKNNEFLIERMRTDFAEMNTVNKRKVILLLGMANAPQIPPADLDKKDAEYQEAVRAAALPNPYEKWDRIVSSAQVDFLWGEFYATGSYKPLRRILELLENTEDGEFFDSFRGVQKRPATDAEFDRVVRGALQRAVYNTVENNAKRHPLVMNYCIWALNNGDLSQNVRNEIARIFDLEYDGTPNGTESKKASAPVKSAPTKVPSTRFF